MTRLFASPLLLALLGAATIAAEKPPAEWVAKGEEKRAAIPKGGNFSPEPEEGIFVAVGHGARILVSRDEGKTWTQNFFGYPGSDHGGWATSAVAYTEGVFAVPVGWTKPTTYLASDDGVNWRHLTNGAKPVQGKDPLEMPTTMSMAGGEGVFVGSGYTIFTRTPDFGKTWSTFSLGTFRGDPRKLVTHHIKTEHLGDGRFLALGDDRSKTDPKFGNLFASGDLGQTWTWLDPKGLEAAEGKSQLATKEGLALLIDSKGQAFRSSDGGQTWAGPTPTGVTRATLSVAGDEFWVTGENSAASRDGVEWRPLPAAVPPGKVAASETGTLINIDAKRFTILRSADGGESWQEVHQFAPSTEYVHGAQGLRDLAYGKVKAVK